MCIHSRMQLPQRCLALEGEGPQDSQLPMRGVLFLAQGGSRELIHRLAVSTGGGRQAQVPTGSSECDFRLVQTPLWSPFLKLGKEYRDPRPIRYPGQTICGAPVGFAHPPPKSSLILTQPLRQLLSLLSTEWGATSQAHQIPNCPPPHISSSNGFLPLGLCTCRSPGLQQPSQAAPGC